MPNYIIQGKDEVSQNIQYEVDLSSAPLGAGGMGQVFKGIQVNLKTGQRKDVAIKFLYQDLSQSAINRSRREASIQIQNENLIEMMGFVEMNESDKLGNTITRNFIVSELLHGVMLHDLLQGKITDAMGNVVPFAEELYDMLCKDRVAFAKFVAIKVLSGVMALHDRGYIHRDIDPSNIMVTNDGKVKLIDFGIAKELEDVCNNSQKLTKSGSFIGKPSYAAPELITGDVASHNFTTDLYQVGILLYELIVGERPFCGPEHEVMSMQLNDAVPSQNIHNIGLANIVKKATNKKQSERYQSAAQFRADLEGCNLKVNEEQTQKAGGNLFWVIIITMSAFLGILLGVFL